MVLVQPKIGIICQNLIIGGEEGEGKKRLVDLRRSSLMASPQVKRQRIVQLLSMIFQVMHSGYRTDVAKVMHLEEDEAEIWFESDGAEMR